MGVLDITGQRASDTGARQTKVMRDYAVTCFWGYQGVQDERSWRTSRVALHDSFCDGDFGWLLLAILIGSVYTAGPSERQDRQRAFKISLTPTRGLIRSR